MYLDFSVFLCFSHLSYWLVDQFNLFYISPPSFTSLALQQGLGSTMGTQNRKRKRKKHLKILQFRWHFYKPLSQEVQNKDIANIDRISTIPPLDFR